MSGIPGWCLVFFVFCIAQDKTEACNGYDIKVTSVKTCENSVIKFNPPITVTADTNCNLFFSGCSTVPKQITFAKATYSIRKPPLPDMEGEVDICNAFTTPSIPQITTFLGVFNLPGKCPVPAKKFCADGKKPVSIAKFKNGLGLILGTTTGKIKVKHDGGSSCVEFTFTTTKSASG